MAIIADNQNVSKRKMKILIVDDNEGDKLLIEALLSQRFAQRFEIIWSRSFSEASKMLAEENVAAALIDYQLGDGTGLDLLKQQQTSDGEFPLIMMSGHDVDGVDQEILQAGAADFIPKNEMTTVLLERTIRYAIEKNEIQRSLRNKEKSLRKQNVELNRTQENLKVQNASIVQLTKLLADTTLDNIYQYGEEGLNNSAAGDSQVNAQLGLWRVNSAGETVFINKMMKEMLGLSGSDENLEKITFGHVASCFSEDDRGKVEEELIQDRAPNETSCFHATLINLNDLDDSERHVILSIANVSESDGDKTLLVTMIDVTKRRETEKNIQEMIYSDYLTGLSNRLAFNAFLPQILTNAARNKYVVGVFYLDLDDFKKINDIFGHPVGDKLLKFSADKLKSQIRNSDVVSRLSGDEFGIILNNLHSADDAGEVALNILESFKEPFIIDGHTINVSCSIGIALYPLNGTTADSLIRDADMALYRAKKNKNKSSFEFFDNSLHQKVTVRRNLEYDLMSSLQRLDQFNLHYQPIAEAENVSLRGVEALLRWNHKTKGMLLPKDFLHIAEHSGMILPIGQWVLNQACEHMVQLQTKYEEIQQISINLSPTQFFQEDLLSSVSSVLDATNCNPHNLVFEITEYTVINNLEKAKERIRDIKSLGIQVALDDFGAEYSSFSLLKELPVDILKIDRSFIHDLHENEKRAAIVKGVIFTADLLGISVTAEGIEKMEELEMLRQFGCHYLQGFLIGKPTSDGLLLNDVQ